MTINVCDYKRPLSALFVPAAKTGQHQSVKLPLEGEQPPSLHWVAAVAAAAIEAAALEAVI